MIWLALIAVLVVAGALACWVARWSALACRWICLAALLADLVIALVGACEAPSGRWMSELSARWIPQWGASFHLGADGLSLLLILLTLALGVMSVLASWDGISSRVGLFHLNLMWVLAGVIGVFVSLDLFLFYFFWELMLVPMYFLISVWGHENRGYAATKFFLFTQASGLLMLLSILGIYFVHGRMSGIYTFDYAALASSPVGGRAGLWLMLGFFAAFAVKLPMVPLHTWLPDAHTEAPTAGSVILAGLLLKTGGYGFIRFVIVFFPDAAALVAPAAMALGIAGIIYGSIQAYGQTDFKRLVAYTSVSHLGFVLLGVFAGTTLALQGAIVQMICHGLSTGALFILAGAIQDRIHTRELGRMGGFWDVAPRMGSAGMFFAMASLGLPGLGGFVGEFLTLLGTYESHPVFAIVGSLGFVVSVAYSLRLVQEVFHGARAEPAERALPDLTARETWMMGLLMAALVWIGVFPSPVLRTAAPWLAPLSTQKTMEARDAGR